MTIPHVFAAENNTIQIVLIGCGGRGGGAADNALSINKGPIKLVGMVDVFQDKLDAFLRRAQQSASGQGGIARGSIASSDLTATKRRWIC